MPASVPVIFQFLFLFLLLTTSGCAVLTTRVNRAHDISYTIPNDKALDSIYRSSVRQQLDIYAPRIKPPLNKVLIFIHGGNWNSGDKFLYRFLGNRLARKGIVTVIVNYRLSPKAGFKAMARDVAGAVKWVKENIRAYGGNPEALFLAGHSAGGHLAALVTVDTTYFEAIGLDYPVKGAILIDAAGLNMYSYLKEKQYEKGHTYLRTFTADPEIWRIASPINHIHRDMPPLLIYLGGHSYASIIKSNKEFIKALEKYVAEPNIMVQKPKRHIPMILQFLFTLSPRYKEIKQFMENPEGYTLD